MKFKQWIKNFPWRTIGWIVTTLIAMVGGCPGYESYTAKAEFKFIIAGTIQATLLQEQSLKKLPCILVSGAFYNGGKAPLFPFSWELKVFFDDEPAFVPASAISVDFHKVFPREKRIYEMNNLHTKDLMNVTRMNPLDATFGALLFIPEYPTWLFDDNPGLEYQIVCRDLLDKKYYSEKFKIDTGDFGNFIEPRLGIYIYDSLGF